MVAFSCDHCASIDWPFSCDRRGKRCSSVHIYFILNSMNREKNIESILVICTGFVFIFLITKLKIFITLSFFIGVIGVFSDYLSSKINWLWTKLAHVLGYVNSKILLSLVFFLVLMPISLLMRLGKKDSLRLKKHVGQESYFEDKNHEYRSSDIENTW